MGQIHQYSSTKLCYRTQNLNVSGSGGKATAPRGTSPEFLGNVAGYLHVIDSNHLGNNEFITNETVYYVVNGLNNSSSSYWSNSNLNEPKLKWE